MIGTDSEEIIVRRFDEQILAPIGLEKPKEA
jgi:hypothetical protein